MVKVHCAALGFLTDGLAESARRQLPSTSSDPDTHVITTIVNPDVDPRLFAGETSTAVSSSTIIALQSQHNRYS